MKIRTLLALCCLFAALLLPVLALADYQIIPTADVLTMIEQKKPMVLIDARTPAEYDEAHIITSINIPEKTFATAVTQLPADKSTLLVIYCNGTKCGKSKRVGKQIEALGYTNIQIYSEGIPVWEEKELPLVKGPGYGKKIETTKYTPTQLDALIKANTHDYVLIDVRDTNEFAEGHIPTAINIPADSLAAKSDSIPKETKVIVYCNTGSRSYLAYKKLIGLAYPHIFQTLFADWKDAGMPVQR